MKDINRHLQYRHAFTLLELLIVITIIAVLMGLSVSVMFGIVSQAEEEATVTTVRKVDALLQQRIESFDRAFNSNRKQAAVNNIGFLLASQNIHGVRDEVQEILAKKALFRFEFPQRIDERRLFGDADTIVTGIPDTIFLIVAAPNARQQLINEGNAAPNDADVRDRVISNWANHLPETESAALLHFSLIASGSFGVGAVDGDRFTTKEVADTDGDGLPEFIDAWGNPLRYYRWPTRLIDITAPNPFMPDLNNPTDNTDTRVIVGQEREIASLLFKGLSPPPLPLPNGAIPRDLLLTDPDDPVGRLYSELERLDGNDGRPLFALEFNETKYHTPETYHTPLVVSAGKDGELGLREPTESSPLPPVPPTGIFGNLAQLEGTTAFSPNQAPTPAVVEKLLDNITNRNRRAGGRR